MSQRGKYNRRSFLGSILGAGAGAGALALITGAPAQGQPTDMDRNDSPGRLIPYNGITDHDHTDGSGHGRGLYTGHTDHDGMDQARHGRNLPNTDRDMVDRAGHGRNFTTPPTTPPTTGGSGNQGD